MFTRERCDGPGRTKPDVVAPAQWTSTATPIIASCADLLITTAPGMAGIAGWGNGSSTNALFNQPRGIVATTGGILFVADTGNGEIRRIAADGTVTTPALSEAYVPPPPVTPTTTIPPTPPTGGGSSGGGGALTPAFLLALAALGFARMSAQAQRTRSAE